MRTIAAVTVARSDYGVYLPVLRRIEAEPELHLSLLVSGMHLSPDFGLTVQMIEADGFEIGDRIDMLLASDTPQAISKSIGIGVTGFAQSFARQRPDILLVLGDRFEMFAAVLAALPFKIPVAHIHGGEVTEGAIDDALRHAMTKLSHLHFVATDEYGRRVAQLGEEPWRIVNAGAPSLDNLKHVRRLTSDELTARFGISLEPAPLLITFHPVTLEFERTEWQVKELLAAFGQINLPQIFTLPNADTNGRVIIRLIEEYVAGRPSARLVANLGTEAYFSVMAAAAAMVGNSSSGMVEALSFKLPVVNVGNRQKGRVRPGNVIDVGYDRSEIVRGIQQAMDKDFRARLDDLSNPYGDGHAADTIVNRLKEVQLNEQLIVKRFVDQT